jgi:glycosidase
MQKTLFFCLILITVFSSCVNRPVQPTPAPTMTAPTPSASELQITPTAAEPEESGYPWWNETVFYEIFVRSFYDSNGDGIGDLQGLIQKLDYLNDGDPDTKDDLGITGIWLMPIFQATSYHGYDVTDYYSIQPDYGTMEDFKQLLAEAHARGIRVIIDLVINHTSVEHPWFVESRSDKNSPYRDWYIWSDTDPGYLGPWNQDVWHFNYDNSYYYGIFWSGMPDLNFKNPAVTAEVNKISSFWLSEIGVDGFRVDGARHLIEEGQVQANTESTLAWFEQFNIKNKELNPELMTVGEVWDSNFSAAKYVKDKAFDLVFDFELSESLLEGINGNDGKQIKNAIEFNTKLFPYLQKANFLTNHDMNRVMSVFQQDPAKAKLGALFLLTISGVPFIYYGEEVGMLGSKPDEDIRKPMQWTASENAGFSTFSPWRAPNANYAAWNVAVEASDSDSLMNFYKQLIALRAQNSALAWGSFIPLDTDEPGVVAFLRGTDRQKIVVLANVGKTDEVVKIVFPKAVLDVGSYQVTSLLDETQFPALTVSSSGEEAAYMPDLTIPAGGYFLLKLAKE